MVLQEDATVDALIDPITKDWKVHLVRQIFREEEAELICNIPLSKHQQKDKLIWKPLLRVCSLSGVPTSYNMRKIEN
jgi:hypothetical protein